MNPLQGIFNYFLYRRAFRVTATDTRPEPSALPRVRVTPALPDSYGSGRMSRNQTLQKITSSTSPPIKPPNEFSGRHSGYTSRLLGE